MLVALRTYYIMKGEKILTRIEVRGMEYLTREQMFERAKELYRKRRWKKEALRSLVGEPKAHSLMFLTEEEYEQITGEKYKPTE